MSVPAGAAAARSPDAARRAGWIAAGFGALYLLTRARVHTWDAIAYAARAAGDPLLADRYLSTALFHPHHLLYAPLAVAAHRALAPLGLARDPLFPPQALSALCGALSTWLAGRLALRLGAGPRRALAVTVAVGVSNAVWRFSTEALVMVPSLAFLLLGAWLAAGARSRRAWLASGLAVAGAMLIHQSAAVFAAAATLTLAVAGRGGRAVPGAATAFALGWALPAGGAYLAVGAAATGGLDPAALAGWAFTAGHRTTSLHASPLGVARETAAGLSEAWVTLTPWRDAALRRGPAALATLVGVAAALAAAAAALPGLARALRAGAPAVSMLVAGAAATAALVAAFQPWVHAYWVYFPALGAALVAAHLPALPRASRWAAAAGIAAVALVNLVVRALPATDPARAPYADLLATARERFAPGDRLICGGSASPIAEGVIALPFFARVPVVLAPTPGDAAQTVRFGRLVDEALTGGSGAVYVTSDALPALTRHRPGLVLHPAGSLRGLGLYRVGTPPPVTPSSR